MSAAVVHGAGHAAVAWSAGGLVRSLSAKNGLGPSAAMWGPEGILGRPSAATDPRAMAALAAVALLLRGAGGVCAAYAQARIAGRVATAMRLERLDHWLNADPLRPSRHTDHRGAGDPVRRVAALTAHLHDVEAGLKVGLLGGVRAIAQLVPLACVLVWAAPRLALFALAVLLPFGLGLGALRRRWKSAHGRALQTQDALLGAADEAIRHADLWKAYGAQKRIRDHVRELSSKLVRAAARNDAAATALSHANEVLGAMALFLALSAASRGWMGGASPGALLSFSVAFFLAYKPIRELTEARLASSKAVAALDVLGELESPAEAASPVPTPSGNADSTPSGEGGHGGLARTWALASLEVSLRLSVGACPLVAFTVRPGQVLAIIGPTGAGKTTLLRALLGLERAEGSLRYGADELAHCPSGPSHRPFAWVPQDAPILADTLDANVRLTDRALPVQASMHGWGAGPLGEELATLRIGAGGRGLSGGERQWIALARASSSELPVLLLDEPTSGLDPAAQRAVLDAIARMRGHRTVILVTHRREPLAIADAVLLLDRSGARWERRYAEEATIGPGRRSASAGPLETRTSEARRSSPSST